MMRISLVALFLSITSLQAADPLPGRALTRLGEKRFRQAAPILSVLPLAQGERLLTAGQDQTVRLWETATGRELLRLHSPSPIRCMALAPDESLIATGSTDRVVRLWDARTGAIRSSYEEHGDYVEALAFAPDGKCLVSGSGEGSLIFWDLARAQVTRRGDHPRNIRAMAYHPSGQKVAVGGSDSLVLWDPVTGMPRGSLPGAWVSALAYSPDGRMLAVASHGPALTVLDTITGKEIRCLQDTNVTGRDTALSGIAFSADGETLAAALPDGQVRLYEIPSGKLIRTLTKPHLPLRTVAFLPRTRQIVVGGGTHSLRFLDRDTGHETDPGPGHTGAVISLGFNSQGKTLGTVGTEGNLHLWNLSAPGVPETITPRVGLPSAVAFGPPSAPYYVAHASGGIQARNEDRTPTRIPDMAGHRGGVNGLALTPEILFSWGRDRTVRAWDRTTGRERAALGPMASSSVALAVTPEARLVAVACSDNTARLWDFPGRQELLSLAGHPGGMTSLVLWPDGRTVATAGRDGTVRLWEVATGRERAILRGHGSGVECMALSADGTLLACGTAAGPIVLWKPREGRQLGRLEGHDGAVKSVQFSPEDQRLASGGADTTILLWDLKPYRGAQIPPTPLAPDRFESLWTDLGQTDADRAYVAIHALVSSHNESVRRLAERVRPVARGFLTTAIANLDNESFRLRDQATRDLTRAGVGARAALQNALDKGPSTEARRRIMGMLEGLESAPADPERLRSLRALEILEVIATAEARAVLQGLAEGEPLAEITREAQTTLNRMKRP